MKKISRKSKTTRTKAQKPAPEVGAIGIDVGDRTSVFVVISTTGDVVERGRLTSSRDGLRGTFGQRPAARIAIEAGTHSPWMSRELAELGHEVIVANPRQLRLITESSKKNDPRDAELLARLARADAKLLHPIQHRGAQAQADLARVRSRKALVENRSKLISHTRGQVKSWGARIRPCSAEAFHRRAPQDIPKELWPALSPVIDLIASLTKAIAQAERDLELIAEKRYPETERLRQIKGVGLLVALCFVLTIDDPRRFKKSRDVGSYVGLRPRLSESGDRQPELPITKQGDRQLRALLVQSAHYILGNFGPDTDLRRWGLRLADRGRKNAKKRAVVAVARKLAVLLHALWVGHRPYVPLRDAAAA